MWTFKTSFAALKLTLIYVTFTPYLYSIFLWFMNRAWRLTTDMLSRAFQTRKIFKMYNKQTGQMSPIREPSKGTVADTIGYQTAYRLDLADNSSVEYYYLGSLVCVSYKTLRGCEEEGDEKKIYVKMTSGWFETSSRILRQKKDRDVQVEATTCWFFSTTHKIYKSMAWKLTLKAIVLNNINR